MKARYKISIITIAFAIFGVMLYVDLMFCYNDVFPPSEDTLLFAVCSDVFGVERVLAMMSNTFYELLWK